MEFYKKDEFEILLNSLTCYLVSMNKLKSNIETEFIGNDLDKFKDDIVSIYSIDTEIKSVEEIRTKILYFYNHKEFKTEDKTSTGQELL